MAVLFRRTRDGSAFNITSASVFKTSSAQRRHFAFGLELFTPTFSTENWPHPSFFGGRVGCQIKRLRRDCNVSSGLSNDVDDTEQQPLLDFEELVPIASKDERDNLHVKRKGPKTEKSDMHRRRIDTGVRGDELANVSHKRM